MVIERLTRAAAACPDRPFLIERDGTVTYGQAARWVAEEARRIADVVGAERPRYLLHARDGAALAVALLAGAALGAETCVVNRAYAPEEVGRAAERFRFGHAITDADLSGTGLCCAPLSIRPPADDGAATLADHPDARHIVMTTGTTGAPKGAVYRWPDLLAQIRVREDQAESRFLLAYPLNHFAGLQMLLHALANGAALVIPPSLQMADVVEAMARHAVDRASATATFWRFLVGYCGGRAPEGVSLKSITIGGEASTPALLEQLAAMFPGAPVSQVYASTEAGSCFSVRDLRRGFPAAWLDDPARDPQLRVEEGELHIRSGRSMLGYYDPETGVVNEVQGRWFPTGDLVRVEGDRVVFLGRKTEAINVGGVKVHPPEVEEVVQRVPGVSLARVYGRPNPVTGHIVAVDVVPADGAEPEALKAAIRDACAAALSRYQTPRLIRIVDELEMANQKVVRRASEE